MQMPAVALFGAGNVAVRVFPPEASFEMKRNIYSTLYKLAVQLSDRGGSRIFIGKGPCRSLDDRFGYWKCAEFTKRALSWSKKAFSCQKGASVGGRGAVSA